MRRLARDPDWTLGVVSGRKLSELKRKVGLKGLIYAGNHGYEVQFREGHVYVHPGGRATRSAMQRIHGQLKRRVRGLPGVILENKIYTLSLHTRLAAHEDERLAHLFLREVVTPFLGRRRVQLKRGKKVLEVRPAFRWNKGEAVKLILKATGRGCVPIYIGDDNTDEDAFRVLAKRGITIRVGAGETRARYSIDHPRQMPDLLERIAALFR